MPAYISTALDQIAAADDLPWPGVGHDAAPVTEFLVMDLTPTDVACDWWNRRIDKFAAKEIEVIIRFLRVVAGRLPEVGADDALPHWLQLLSARLSAE